MSDILTGGTERIDFTFLDINGAAVDPTGITVTVTEPIAVDDETTVTVTIASPAVVTAAGHLLRAGEAVTFSTTGSLPTGLTAGATYYVIATGLTADTFQVSTTLGGAAVNTSGSQTGTHTLDKQRAVTYTLAGGGVVNDPSGVGKFYIDHPIEKVGVHVAKGVATSPRAAAITQFVSIG